MKVFETQLRGFNGPCVVHELESVIDELKQTLPVMVAGDSFTVTVAEMDWVEYDSLPEFMGY